MRSLAFFVIPASILFLLVSLGLVADGVAEISKIVKFYNNYGSSGSGGGGGGRTSSYRPYTYSTINTDGGGVFGSAFSSYSPYSFSSYSPYSFSYSSFDYDSALSSIYSKYSLSRREEQPTGIARREMKGSPTVAPVVRQIPQSTPAPLIKRVEQQHTLQKRRVTSISQAKSINAAILAFYALQLVVIVALLVTGILFLIKFRKLDDTVQGKITNLQNNNINANTQNLEQSSELQETSNSIYQRTNFIKKFFTIYIILTVLYFIFGIVSWGLFGSFGGIILGVAAATIAFWVFTFLSCVAICVTLLLDRRSSEEDEHALRNPSSFDGGEYGSKSDGMITTPSQQHQQTVSMPQLQTTPAGWQQSTAEHQQQHSQQTYAPNNEARASTPASPPPQQQQQPQSSGPIEGQVYKAVKDEHGNTQMVPVNL
jgi:hypothetical protein